MILKKKIKELEARLSTVEENLLSIEIR